MAEVGVKCNLLEGLHMAYREKRETRLRKFMEKVSMNEETGCMEWVGAMLPNGYGQVGFRGKLWVAHRAFWVFMGKPDPGGFDLDHLCRNRKCINPDHLELVSRGDNLRRGFIARGCKNGHPYSPEDFSVVKRSNGIQELRCKVCHRERNRKAKQARKERLRESAS